MARRAKTQYNKKHGYATSSRCPSKDSVVMNSLDEAILHHITAELAIK